MHVNGAITDQEKCSRMARFSSVRKLRPAQQRRHGLHFPRSALPTPLWMQLIVLPSSCPRAYRMACLLQGMSS